MLFSVNTNNNSLLAQQYLMRTNVGLNKSVAKLSSGSRINSSSDDAAGLSVAENIKKRSSEFKTLTGRDANNGLAVYQNKNAVDSSNEVANIVKRMRELEIQSASEPLATDGPTHGGERPVAQQNYITSIKAVAPSNGSASYIAPQVPINRLASIYGLEPKEKPVATQLHPLPPRPIEGNDTENRDAGFYDSSSLAQRQRNLQAGLASLTDEANNLPQDALRLIG